MDYLTKDCYNDREETLKQAHKVFNLIDRNDDGFIHQNEMESMFEIFVSYMKEQGSKINVKQTAKTLAEDWIS